MDHNIKLDRLISASCGAAFILFLESEYAAWKLIKNKKSLFFFVCQLTIISSLLETIFTALIYFKPNLEVLPMLITVTLGKFSMIVSYPIMILLRLKILSGKISVGLICICLFQGVLWTILDYFWEKYFVTHDKYFIHTYDAIIQPIETIFLMIQNVVINIFFIILAIKNFESHIHIKYVIIINIIIIAVECVVVVIEFIFMSIWTIFSVSYQIKIRLELIILVYIVESFLGFCVTIISWHFKTLCNTNRKNINTIYDLFVF
jgi:hypothetical protein